MTTDPQTSRFKKPNLPVSTRMDLLIGNTPLMRLSYMGNPNIPIFIKLENVNPSGSIRDRYIAEIVERAFAAGQIQSGDSIALAGIDDSAVSAAFVGSVLKLKTFVFAPQSSSQRLLPLLERYGASVVWTEDCEGLQGAVRAAAGWARESYDRLYVDGYRRQAVKDAYQQIANEILIALPDMPLGGFVTSVTTGATFREVSRVLRAVQTNLEVRGARIIENEFATAEENPFIHQCSLKEIWRVRDEIAQKEGLLLGPKGAACVAQALRLQNEVTEGQAIVALNPDAGQRYVGWEQGTLFKANFVPN